MTGKTAASVAPLVLLLGCAVPASSKSTGPGPVPRVAASVSNDYLVAFDRRKGEVTVQPRGSRARLAIQEIPGSKSSDLLYSSKSFKRAGNGFVVEGRSSWATYIFRLSLLKSDLLLIHWTVSVKPFKDAPIVSHAVPDVRLEGASASSLKEYAPAPPVAGTSVMVSSKAFGSTALYFSNYTALGQYFARTNTGATQGAFTYPNAGTKGSLVGASGDGRFGYVVSLSDVSSLPHNKPTTVIDSYLCLVPVVPSGEAAVAGTYLHLLGDVYAAIPEPKVPAADWKSLASKEAVDLLRPANMVTVAGRRYLRSYVSDTRSAPELITQAGVLAGVKAYEGAYHTSLPLESILEDNLPTFYDPQFHSVVNGLGHDASATDESWYYVDNMISLLQAAQLGSSAAKKLLLDSASSAIKLAHVNSYEFPQTFRYSDWNGRGTGVQADVAGGYAWLMLGLYDLTKDGRFLDEAKASLAHAAGKGFNLSYETHMTAYTAAAAQRLYRLTNDSKYHGEALLALANLFHETRLWDCTYALCKKGDGYHTYFGLNPLPWSDYVAMLEQYEAWLGLRDYLTYAAGEPAYVTSLVRGFLTYSPRTLQYALPPLLPKKAAAATPGEYSFVPRNDLSAYIPLEDLREGEATSGIIGQEIYGAGGPFMFAAYG